MPIAESLGRAATATATATATASLAALLVTLTLGASPALARRRDKSRATRCLRGSVNDLAVRRAIAQVFKRHGSAAIRVARCESGRRGTRARNGQYRGLFQMGRYARRTYGHSRCARAQARAAYRYFVAVGKRWAPWHNCRPREHHRKRLRKSKR